MTNNQTQQQTQMIAFCASCRKPVLLPHVCAGVVKVKIKGKEIGV